MKLRAHWTIVLEGNDCSELNLVALVEGLGLDIKITSANCSSYWTEEKVDGKTIGISE